MIECLKLRTLVIGNSGSGKSSLAEGLGALIHAPVFDLDLIHWKDDGFGAKQDEDMAWQKIADLAATQRWVTRGLRCGGTEADFAELLRWAEAYRDRQTPTSLKGHQSITIRWNPLPLMICAFGAHRH
jgi:hypothetical protein